MPELRFRASDGSQRGLTITIAQTDQGALHPDIPAPNTTGWQVITGQTISGELKPPQNTRLRRVYRRCTFGGIYLDKGVGDVVFEDCVADKIFMLSASDVWVLGTAGDWRTGQGFASRYGGRVDNSIARLWARDSASPPCERIYFDRTLIHDCVRETAGVHMDGMSVKNVRPPVVMRRCAWSNTNVQSLFFIPQFGGATVDGVDVGECRIEQPPQGFHAVQCTVNGTTPCRNVVIHDSMVDTDGQPTINAGCAAAGCRGERNTRA